MRSDPIFLTFGIILASVLLLGGTSTVQAQTSGKSTSTAAVTALNAWLATARDQRKPIEQTDFATAALTKEDAEAARKLLWADHAEFIRTTRAAEMQAKVIEMDGKKMKFEILDFKGPKPAQGRSLFISMHGGGGAPPPVNESQWRNQVAMGKDYHPAEGIYLAPRAPTDAWNLWHESHIDAFFDRLIENLIVLENVNPNRVYILGYSAGGDGVYQLAPRMSDRLAAASMMAGHPNEASPLGLRNVPFALQVGENDSPFNRNRIAGEWGKKLDDLQRGDPQGYIHFCELHAGKSHWMDMEDRKAIPWMEKFTRHPLPDKIVWRQDDVTHARSYWMAVPKESATAGQEITVQRQGQTFTITATPSVKHCIVMLNDFMADLDRPITILVGGTEVFSGNVTRTIAQLAKTLAERGDPELIFSAAQSVTLLP